MCSEGVKECTYRFKRFQALLCIVVCRSEGVSCGRFIGVKECFSVLLCGLWE